jgi:hypothetical protein
VQINSLLLILWQCRQCDITTQGWYVSIVGKSSSEEETGTLWNWNSEQSRCVLVYLYRNNYAVWPTIETCIFKKPQVHMKHPKIFTFTVVNVQTGAHFVAQTCESGAISWSAYVTVSTGMIAVHTAWMLSWLMALLCCNTVILFLYKYIKAQFRFHVVDISSSLMLLFTLETYPLSISSSCCTLAACCA